MLRVFLPDIRRAVEEKAEQIKVFALGENGPVEMELTLGDLTDNERQIILDGCLINYNRNNLLGKEA